MATDAIDGLLNLLGVVPCIANKVQVSDAFLFKKTAVVDPAPLKDSVFKLYIADKAWLELDEASISAGILQKIKATL